MHSNNIYLLIIELCVRIYVLLSHALSNTMIHVTVHFIFYSIPFLPHVNIARAQLQRYKLANSMFVSMDST